MKEREIGVFEAKNRLSALLEDVLRGERIWITRRGQRVALLSSGIEEGSEERDDLVGRFREFRKQVRPGPGTIKEMIEEGRK